MKALLITFNLLCGADATTTHAILTRGGREVLLPTQNPWVVDGVVTGEAFAASKSLQVLSRTHPKTARIIGWSLVGLRSVVVVNNVHQLRKP